MLPKLYRIVVLVACAHVVLGCSSDTIVDPPPGQDGCEASAVTAVATVGQALTIFAVGSGGGSFFSYDRKLTLDIPAGALSSDVELFIQDISSHAPLAVGSGYRIVTRPAIASLALPATLRIKYSKSDIEGTVASAVGLAYQDGGIWKAIGVVRNEQDSNVTATMTRLGDWSMYTAFAMRSNNSPVVELNGSYKAQIYVQPKIALLDTLSVNGSVPLCIPIVSATASEVRVVGEAGSGTASSAGGTATYSAPPDMPNKSGVAMMMRWPSSYHWGTVELYNDLWIGGVIEFRLDGKLHTLPISVLAFTSSAHGKTSMAGGTRPGVMPMRMISLSFGRSTAGAHAMMNVENSTTNDDIAVSIDSKEFGKTYQLCVNGKGELLRTDLGTVTIDRADTARGFITGSFSGDLGAQDGTLSRCGSLDWRNWQTYPITGTFRSAWARF